MKTVSIVHLKYDITFQDSDEGKCFAGDGERLMKVFKDESDAKTFVETWNPIIKQADKETTVFPIQYNNKMLKQNLGFSLHDFDQEEENYRLEYKTYNID